MRRCTLMLLLALLCLGANVFSQETTSEIQGKVTDESGAPLSGATVIALHTPSGTKYATSSRKDGRFNLPNLRVGGPYTVTVTYVGYKKTEQENINLLLGQEFKADFGLVSDGKELKEIVVAASRQNKTFNTSHIGSQEIINRTQIERLPTINRSLQDFTRLEPTANGLNIGGRTNQYNNMTVDGANFNNSFGLSSVLGGQTNSQPISIDAIEQIQVNLSPYDVTQGGFAGTGINSVTRSGTNQFKGSVYTFMKGAGTQGYDVGNVAVAKTNINYNLRGFSVGGPIIENKLFFFVSGEQVRQELPATSFTASDASHPAVSGSVSRANKDSLEALIDLLKNNPKLGGYDPGKYQGYNFKTRSDKLTLKLDWNINKNNTLTFKYNYLKSYADQFPSSSRPNNGSSLNTSGSGSANNNALPFFAAGYGINNNFNIFIAELNTRFGNTASNKLQIGYTALRDFRTPHSPNDTMPFVDILDGAANGNIFTSFGYEMYTYNNTLNTDVFQISDIFKMYKGAHELTFGTQDYYRKYQNAFAPAYRGVYQFASLNDFRLSLLYGAANATNYVLQYSALPDGSFPWANAGSTELGFFAQDKWRLLNNLTVTYGLRADMTIYKQSFTDNPYFDKLAFKDGKTYNIGKAPGNALIISPRIGFNWDVFNNKTLQVRGGAGVFSGPPPFVWISNQASNNGIQFGALQTSKVPFGYKPATGGSNTSYSTAMVADDFKYPTVFKSNLAIDKKLPGDWTITLEASYFKDINAVYYSNLNLKQDSAFQLSGVDNRNRYIVASTNSYDVYRSNKYYYNKPSSSSFANNTLDDPSIGTAILMSNSHKGYGYNLTARVEKTFKNLFASVAYTYSASKNVAEGGSTASSLWSARAVGNADPNSANLAYASFYQPHRVLAFASYRFDYGHHFATSIGAVFEASTSGASSYIYNGDVNGDGNTNDLIYIPRNASEINLVPVANSTDTRTAAQIWTQLDNYIKQDNYLNSHRGEYAKANAWVYPWFKKLDLNITQDIYFYSKGKKETNKHTLRLTLDLINAGNFLNKYWGLVKTPNLSSNSSGFQLLKYEGLAADNKTPTYSFPYQDATNAVPYTNSFTNSTGIGSRWQMQFGIRYMFN
ncbi:MULTISPECIES: TonB-dependent receptor [Niastella]|uniref:TonB-dependent receptor n=1 Tax=Niastella soli TaxID=2821487 RepID=A0ABS3Z4E6_9BACT|nr:TonB-dependent receptor [Niastella soli]MBO9205037.1 TonB-dependent receptor [Niastella soli]